MFLSAVVKAVDEYQDLLRITVASAGNDHRLGANEAPPAIISMYLGDDLGALVESIIEGKDYKSHKAARMETLPDFKKDNSDRNRTSPFAFTGNKFEFRALGSSLNIACPNYMLNTMVAQQLGEFYNELKDSENLEESLKALIKKVLTEHQRIIFNGDNYSDEWVKEAEKRGLCNYKSLPDAMEHYIDKKNIELFSENSIVTKEEMLARYEIELEQYSKLLNIEALTMIDMAKKDIAPAVISFVKEVSEAVALKQSISSKLSTYAEEELIKILSNGLEMFVKKTDELEKAVKNAGEHKDNLSLAKYYRNTVFNLMNELRELGDSMEQNTNSKYWPYPSYGEILFGV